MTMCGMAGAFSAIFGTPLAATIFTLEVVDVGSMQYAALLPCLVSALLGVFISGKMGLAPEAFVLRAEAAPTPDNLTSRRNCTGNSSRTSTCASPRAACSLSP